MTVCRRPFAGRLWRAPALFLAHYRILRGIEDYVRWRAVWVALRLTWAAVRP